MPTSRWKISLLEFGVGEDNIMIKLRSSKRSWNKAEFGDIEVEDAIESLTKQIEELDGEVALGGVSEDLELHRREWL
ncbi:hypothetical protein V6N13_092877 [Hibiscus sabdariffa]